MFNRLYCLEYLVACAAQLRAVHVRGSSTSEKKIYLNEVFWDTFDRISQDFYLFICTTAAQVL